MLCSKCRQDKSEAEFYFRKDRLRGYQSQCKICQTETTKRSRNRHPKYWQKYLETAKAYRRRVRRETIEYYGGKCQCCGESNIEFLSFDHINGNGRQHRKTLRTGDGHSFVLWLIRNNYPDSIRLLCYNCNCARGFSGYCPHELNKEVVT